MDTGPVDQNPEFKTSLMFLVHPTITIEQIHGYGKAIKKILLKATVN